ncbi:MAG: ATP-binding protein [Brevefilum sp.]|nr:ATP-binding protein [Brevefilum sp.]
MFLNRRAELDLLEKHFASSNAELFVLYGRRRVGKTELIVQFCQEKRAIFFVSDLGSEISLRAAFSTAINAVLFGPGRMDAVYSSWEALFQTLGQAAQEERLVVVIDEFPYMVAAHPPLASILQKAWDQTLKNTKIMLILCGSYIGMMEETVLGYKAPLFGRRTAQYLLEPMSFKNARLFFPSLLNQDQVRAYAVYGGMPAYLQTIDLNKSLNDNIRDHILSRGSYLYDEARFILQQELREPRNYFAILQAIAAGKTRLNEIKQASGLEGATAYLNTLQQLHLVERVVPVTEKQPQKSRRGIYRLKDHYLRFWFRYIHPNRSQLERGGAQTVLQNQVLPEIDHYSSLAFEEICQQYFWLEGLSGKFTFLPLNVGRWWNASEEIDLAVIGEKDVILVECKWSNRPVGKNVLADLERKAEIFHRILGDRKTQYALCSRSGFTSQLIEMLATRSEVLLLDLNQILKQS